MAIEIKIREDVFNPDRGIEIVSIKALSLQQIHPENPYRRMHPRVFSAGSGKYLLITTKTKLRSLEVGEIYSRPYFRKMMRANENRMKIRKVVI